MVENNSILIITGTRPEIIKMAPVYCTLKDKCVVKWCHTGQHNTLANQAFNAFNIKPDFTFKRPKTNDISQLLAKLLENINHLLENHLFNAILVHGDTASTLAGALAAFYNKTYVIAHIEAGLRSHDLCNPYPEESNRILVAKIANLHFAPTNEARANLLAEGVDARTIIVTGNTAIDAQHLLINKNKELKLIKKAKTILITAHRRENWEHIDTICQSIRKLAILLKDYEFVFSLHPNPIIETKVIAKLNGIENIKLVKAIDYLSLQKLLAESVLVMTDSGGIQEEALSYKTKIIVLRETTERMQVVQTNMAVLVGATNIEKIITATLDLLKQKIPDYLENPFGDGTSSKKIAAELLVRLK